MRQFVVFYDNTWQLGRDKKKIWIEYPGTMKGITIELPYFISEPEGIFPSNIRLAALAQAFPGPMVATARTRSPLEKQETKLSSKEVM